MKGLKIAAIAAASVSAMASADVTLSGFATADNLFEASISTSATAQGTVFFSGNSWTTTYNGSAAILDAGTYYLHVRAQDQGRPEMFIGNFSLTGDATFANGTQSLLTGLDGWVVSTSGFGVNTTSVSVLGPNGGSPWGQFAAMGAAEFIWAPTYDQGVAYFTAQFTVVPAPATLAVAAMGLVAVRRRR